MKLFAFRLQDGDFGIESTYLYRILDDVCITPVCGMPPFYLGLLYYRGELFDVIDLNALMCREASERWGRRLMVIRWDDRKLALSTNSILGLLWIEADRQQDTFISQDERSVRRITPQQIWDRIRRQLEKFNLS